MPFSWISKILTLVLISIALTGCFEKEETHTVEWFSQHKKELNATLKRCSDNPGELSETPNCKNAMAAALQDSKGSLRRF